MALIAELTDKALDETETWREDHLGACVAYLCDAISHDDIRGCEFTDKDRGADDYTIKAHALLRKWFPDEAHPIWRYVS